MILLHSEYFNRQLQKIATAIIKTAFGQTIYGARTNHDIQPLSTKRGVIDKPRDKTFKKKVIRKNLSMSHLEDKKITNAHLKGK